MSGGALLQMADEVAALAASKHTMGGTPTTACMDAVNFDKTIPKGSSTERRDYKVMGDLS